MMTVLATFPWLSFLIAFPLAGALLCILLRRWVRTVRWLSLGVTSTTLLVVIVLFLEHRCCGPGWLRFEDYAWIETYGIRFTLALDGLSLLLILLASFLQLAAVLISWRVDKHEASFFALLLVLEAGIIGVFLAIDLLLFYLFWEVMLVPMFFLIAVWGHEHRIRAAIKFFIFTMAGSLLMLVAMIALYLIHGQQTGDYTFALDALRSTQLSTTAEYWLYGGFLLAFLVKVPLFPLHNWLPDAHSEAPIAGTVDLAGLLLKTGIYGLVRFAFPLFPEAARASLPLLAILALAGLFHAAFNAYRQSDIKRIIAYSSISHMGLVVLGLAAWNVTAIEGGLLLMVNHGVTTGAMFIAISMVHRRTDTRELAQLGGLWNKTPLLGGFFLFFALASLGVPGLSNFAGEILVLFGVFGTEPLWAVLATLGMVLTAAYILKMVQGVLWGTARDDAPWPDLNWREILLLTSLAVAVVWLGSYPATFMEPLHAPVRSLLDSFPPPAGGAS